MQVGPLASLVYTLLTPKFGNTPPHHRPFPAGSNRPSSISTIGLIAAAELSPPLLRRIHRSWSKLHRLGPPPPLLLVVTKPPLTLPSPSNPPAAVAHFLRALLPLPFSERRRRSLPPSGLHTPPPHKPDKKKWTGLYCKQGHFGHFG